MEETASMTNSKVAEFILERNSSFPQQHGGGVILVEAQETQNDVLHNRNEVE